MRRKVLTVTAVCLLPVLCAFGYESFSEAYEAAQAESQKNNYERTVQVLREAIGLAKTDREKEKAASFLNKAESRYKDWLTHNKAGHPYYESRQLFADAYEAYLDHEYAKARKTAAGVLKVRGGHPAYIADAQFMIGFTWFCERKNDRACKEFEKVLTIQDAPSEQTAKAYQYMGKCLVFEEKYPDAKVALEKALEVIQARKRPSAVERRLQGEVKKQLKSLNRRKGQVLSL